MAKEFPDLTGDGKVTRADVLKGRGVDGMKKGGKVSNKWIQSAIKKPGALKKIAWCEKRRNNPRREVSQSRQIPRQNGATCPSCPNAKRIKEVSFTIGFYLIPGVMLGVEIQRNPNTGNPVLVLDLLIMRFMFEYGNEDDE